MTQDEYDGLIAMLKQILQPNLFRLPMAGKRAKAAMPLASVFNPRDLFVVDIARAGQITPNRYKLQLRYRKDIVLVRLDCSTAPHRNPDGELIGGSHIHLVSEKYGVSYAIPIPPVFSDVNDFVRTLKEFLEYCNVHNISDLTLMEQQGLIE